MMQIRSRRDALLKIYQQVFICAAIASQDLSIITFGYELHIWIVWTTAAFWRYPCNIL